jgi:hypothetical protein
MYVCSSIVLLIMPKVSRPNAKTTLKNHINECFH